jgi:hypothetical protein
MLPLGKSLSALWDIIRPLQYLSIIALVALMYPSELHAFLKNMIDVSGLDIFFGLPITEFLFQFNAGLEPFSDHFNDFGVDNQVYLLNSSSIIIPIVPIIVIEYFVLKVLRVIIKRNIKNKHMRRLGMRIGLLNSNLKNSFMTLLIEGSFDLTFCTMMNLSSILFVKNQEQFDKNFKGYSDITNTIVTFVSFFVVIIYMPLNNVYYAYRNFYGKPLNPEEKLKIESSPFYADIYRRNFMSMIF